MDRRSCYNLRNWLGEATHEVESDDTHWRKMVVLIQEEFLYGTLVYECMWKTAALITKGDGREFRGIGIVEVSWKTIKVIINQRLTSMIKYHDALHGF